MITFIERRRSSMIYRTLCAFVALAFVFAMAVPPMPSFAQTAVPQGVLNLPVPGTMVAPSGVFRPPLIKGLTIHPDNPLKFTFIIDAGEDHLKDEAFEEEAEKLIRYFLASLTIPESEMWVNLSPYEKDRIVPESFGQTEMGRDLIAQDYMLKQLTSSLMYPDGSIGREFWSRVYKKAQEQFGTTEIPINTFNKIWIVPASAEVYVHDGSAFVLNSRLKVMLEEDYLALENNLPMAKHGVDRAVHTQDDPITGVSLDIVREVFLPEIEREVNEGRTFAQLRQIYDALILANWYKDNLRESFLGQVYVDRSKTEGINSEDPQINQKIYEQYVESFKKGVFNYIKEEYDPSAGAMIPRKYFSGGADLRGSSPVSNVRNRGVSAGELNEFIANKVSDPRQVVMELDRAGSSPLTAKDRKKLNTTLKKEKAFAKKEITLAHVKTNPIIEAVREQVGAKKIIDWDLMVLGSSKLQPLPLVAHPDREANGELTVQRIPAEGNIIMARSDEEKGSFFGVLTLGDYVSRLTRLGIYLKGELPRGTKELQALKTGIVAKIKEKGIGVRDLGATNLLRDEDNVVVDEKSITFLNIEGLGFEVDMSVWYKTDPVIGERPITTTEHLKELYGSLMQPSKFTQRPKLSRALTVFIDGAPGATGSTETRNLLMFHPTDAIGTIVLNGANAADMKETLETDSTHKQLLRPGDSIVTGEESIHGKEYEYLDINVRGIERRVYTMNIRKQKKITVDGKEVTVDDLEALPLKDFNVDIAVASTGRVTSRIGLEGYIKAGAKKVILTAPALPDKFISKADRDNREVWGALPILIGVNHDKIPEDVEITDCASCTTNAFVPVLYALEEEVENDDWGIDSVDMFGPHAGTGTNNYLDRNPRSGKNLGGPQNLIQAPTGASQATVPILPHLGGKISAMAVRLFAADGSFAYIRAVINVPNKVKLTKADVVRHLEAVSKTEKMTGILATDEYLLSSAQLIGRSESSLIATNGIRVRMLAPDKALVIIPAGYDNEWGYSNRPPDAIYFLGKQIIDQENLRLGGSDTNNDSTTNVGSRRRDSENASSPVNREKAEEIVINAIKPRTTIKNVTPESTFSELDIGGYALQQILGEIGREVNSAFFPGAEFDLLEEKVEALIRATEAKLDAKTVSSAVEKVEAPGGIDFDRALMSIEVRQNGEGIRMPVPTVSVEDLNVRGFIPLIIDIQPIHNLPMLMGAGEQEAPPYEVSMRNPEDYK